MPTPKEKLEATAIELKLALNLSNGVFYRRKAKPGREVNLPEVEQPTVFDQAAEFITLPQSERVSSSNLSLEVSVGE
jgi:CRISPR/Cas system endoribonuclease Cas6 (RAMP superfamily)